jgi:hypothetical protein
MLEVIVVAGAETAEIAIDKVVGKREDDDGLVGGHREDEGNIRALSRLA